MKMERTAEAWIAERARGSKINMVLLDKSIVLKLDTFSSDDSPPKRIASVMFGVPAPPNKLPRKTQPETLKAPSSTNETTPSNRTTDHV